MSIVIVANSRAERGPLESVIAELGTEAAIASYDATGMSPSIAMAQALPYFTAVYTHQKPKLVIVLGDRYETLAASLAAMFLRIPIAHIHGGETTTGAFDDALRHSITHIAEQTGGLHFCATALAWEMVCDLTGFTGQSINPRAHGVGAPGLDGIPQNSASRSDKLVLVIYHPETMAEDYGVANCRAMLSAIASGTLGYEIVFCGVNADPGHELIESEIQGYLRGHGGRVEADMSHQEYIAHMQRAALVVGNSSAGVIEAPWVGCPSVNVGARQDGREMARSVFQFDRHAWVLDEAMNFRAPCDPIYQGGAAPKIASIVREFVKTR